MCPARLPQKAVTPGAVKVLMLVEAGIIGFLVYWLLNEYVYNAYFHSFVDQSLLGHLTTYTPILGLGIGLAGSLIAATVYRNLRAAKRRLETIAMPKIRGAVDKILSGLPVIDELSTGPRREPGGSQTTVTPTVSKVTAIVPVSTGTQLQKRSD